MTPALARDESADHRQIFFYFGALTMLPVIPFIPKHVVATADGQRNPALEAELFAEIGGENPATA